VTRPRLAIAALVSLALAAGLLLLARDVARWPDAFEAGDVRYRVTPNDRALWAPAQSVPFAPAEALLSVDDDVAFRRALQSLRIAGIDEPMVSDPELVLRRNEARARLAAVAATDAEATRASRALSLVGVLSFASAIANTTDPTPLLREAVARYRRAILLDPENDEAKTNLEFALRRDREVGQGGGGERPTPGGEGAAGAGTKDPGSGY
jgi:hypothetical protein